MTTLFNCVANRPLPSVLPRFRVGSDYIIGHRCLSLRWSLRTSGLLIPTLLASSLGCFFRGMLSIVSAPSFLEGLGHGCPRRAFHEFTKFFDGWFPIRATTMFIEVLDPDVAGGAVDLDASGGAVDDLDVGTAFAADDGRGELRGQRGPSEGVLTAVGHAREHIDDGRGGVSLAFRGHGAEGERAVEHGALLYSAFVGTSNELDILNQLCYSRMLFILSELTMSPWCSDHIIISSGVGPFEMLRLSGCCPTLLASSPWDFPEATLSMAVEPSSFSGGLVADCPRGVFQQLAKLFSRESLRGGYYLALVNIQ